jgi:hypothetical protein
MKRYVDVLLGGVSTFAATLALTTLCSAIEPPATVSLHGQGRITVSQHTTRITEPLTNTGYVDYYAALNQRYSQGVTPDNNAAVLILRALGPATIASEQRAQYFKMLGIEPLPEDGPYLIEYEQFVIRSGKAVMSNGEELTDVQERLQDELEQATRRPWNQETLPKVAAWLEANEEPLKLIVEASQRPRRYDPLMAQGDPPHIVAVALPIVQRHRLPICALAARAMLKLGAGKTAEAWQDLLVCHRLARLTAQGPTIIDLLMAQAMEGITFFAEKALLGRGDLGAPAARQMLDELQHLPPMPRMADVIDAGERYAFLDTVQSTAEHGLGQLDRIIDGPSEAASDDVPLSKTLLTAAGSVMIDWNTILAMGNAWYDRAATATRCATWPERLAAWKEISVELDRLSDNARDPRSLALSVLGGPGRAVSERLGQILILLNLPCLEVVFQIEARGDQNLELIRFQLLLAAYRADHDKYPAQLSDLTPDYLAEVPLDPFTAKPLIYRLQPKGYVLYSVGVNGKDDGGLSYEDQPEEPSTDCDYDDLIVQIPLKLRQ